MSAMIKYITPACLLAILLVPVNANADWPENGVALCDTAVAVYRSFITSNQSGGAIVAWKDQRSPDEILLVQAIDNNGDLLWPAGGVSLSLTAGSSSYLHIDRDGMGGAVIIWTADRTGAEDIFIQSVSSAGVARWTSGGVPVCTYPDDRWWPMVVGNGVGGAMVAWVEFSSYTLGFADIYIQGFTSAGTARWSSNGIRICGEDGDQDNIAVASDGDSGMLVAWEDYRPYESYLGHDNFIYAQKIDKNGIRRWMDDGVPICSAPGRRSSVQLISDGAGGAIFTWVDKRNGNNDIYVQRVNQNGNWQWSPGNGVAVCTDYYPQHYPRIIPDGDGGAIITWYDERNGGYNIYAQSVSSAGAVRWTADGIPICTAAGGQYTPRIVTDGEGGAIISWTDSRNGDYNIYAQSIDATGAARYELDGMPVATAAPTSYSSYLTEASAGEAIVTWVDERDTIPRVYAMKIGDETTDIEPSTPSIELSLSQNYPNPFNPVTTIEYCLPADGHVLLEILDVSGRLVATLVDEEQNMGHHETGWNGSDLAGATVVSGVYLYRLRTGKETISRKMVMLR